jgi:formate dehydrogenase subunit gamma
VLLLALTGWWLYFGGEGNPTPLSRVTGIPDTRLHVWIGRALVGLLIVPFVVGRKGIATFVRETFRFDRGDAAWWRRWPTAIFTGRFARHEGDFDPGQRIVNIGIVAGVVTLVGTGLAMTWLHGGSVFAVLAKVHLVVAALLTALLTGHILVATGVLPGYRGVWRSMHGGKVPERTARRLWPGWVERGRTARR